MASLLRLPLTFRNLPWFPFCLQPGNQWWVPGTALWTFPSLEPSPPCSHLQEPPQAVEVSTMSLALTQKILNPIPPHLLPRDPVSLRRTPFPVFRACLAENTLTEMPAGAPVLYVEPSRAPPAHPTADGPPTRGGAAHLRLLRLRLLLL